MSGPAVWRSQSPKRSQPSIQEKKKPERGSLLNKKNLITGALVPDKSKLSTPQINLSREVANSSPETFSFTFVQPPSPQTLITLPDNLAERFLDSTPIHDPDFHSIYFQRSCKLYLIVAGVFAVCAELCAVFIIFNDNYEHKNSELRAIVSSVVGAASGLGAVFSYYTIKSYQYPVNSRGSKSKEVILAPMFSMSVSIISSLLLAEPAGIDLHTPYKWNPILNKFSDPSGFDGAGLGFAAVFTLGPALNWIVLKIFKICKDRSASNRLIGE